MEMTLSDLENRRLTDLYKLAKEYQISYYSQMKKKELIFAILKARAEKAGLTVHGRGSGHYAGGLRVSPPDQLSSVHRRHLHFRFANPSL